MKKLAKNIKMQVEFTDTGYSTYAEEYPIFSTGPTVTELMHNTLEACNLYFENEDILVSSEDIDFDIDFKQFFQYYRVLNAKFLAEKIGMNPSLLSQYVQGNKKPSKSQTTKILNGIHHIGQELTNINLIYR